MTKTKHNTIIEYVIKRRCIEYQQLYMSVALRALYGHPNPKGPFTPSVVRSRSAADMRRYCEQLLTCVEVVTSSFRVILLID